MNTIISELIRSSDYFYEDKPAQDAVKVKDVRGHFESEGCHMSYLQ
ncbi:MAG: hypothetical protein ACOYJU_04980 [Anaerovoracaceae bacterium]